MIKIGKYEFKNEEQAINKIKALDPNIQNTIVYLGSVLLKDAVLSCLDEEKGIFEILEPPVFGNYRVDVLWVDTTEHPYGWKTYSVDLDDEGIHSFGVSYLENKM